MKAVRIGWTKKSFGDAAPHLASARPRDRFVGSLAESLGLSKDRLVWLNQVHGARVRIIRRPPAGGVLRSTDGCATSAQGLALLIRTADCLPILLYDHRRRAVCALHAGWRGLLGGIVANGVSAVCRLASCRPSSLAAAFGPSIQSGCYEVGEEIRDQFVRRFGSWAGTFFRRNGTAFRMSLAGLAARQLRIEGLRPSAIRFCRVCTACDRDRCYSFRARKDAGRNATFIYMDRRIGNYISHHAQTAI